MTSTENSSGTTAARRTSPHRTRILLAEDDLEMRRLLAWALERDGCEVTECGDGMTVLRRLGLMEPGGTDAGFDLVISDVRMPGYNGLQVLESIRNATRRPPVVLISAFADPATRERADRLGAATLMPKPFDVDDLIAEVHRLLPRDFLGAPADPDPLPVPHPGFPVEITVRHGRLDEPVADFIDHLAARLGRAREGVRRCRVVIDAHDHDGHGGRRADVKLIVETRGGRTLVVGCDAGTGRDPDSLYGALGTVFNTARRHLRTRRVRRRDPETGEGADRG